MFERGIDWRARFGGTDARQIFPVFQLYNAAVEFEATHEEVARNERNSRTDLDKQLRVGPLKFGP